MPEGESDDRPPSRMESEGLGQPLAAEGARRHEAAIDIEGRNLTLATSGLQNDLDRLRILIDVDFLIVDTVLVEESFCQSTITTPRGRVHLDVTSRDSKASV